MRKGVLIVISGFSGAGKGTLVKKLMESYDNYALSISMTTRPPRPGEEHGKSYFFVSEEEFQDTIAKNGFLEYASYCGNYYGTPAAYVNQCLDEGKDVILEIEIQGALKVKEMLPKTILVFVTPPSAEELKKRLVERGTETEEVINKRLQRATEEASGVDRYDYIAINDKLEQCVEDIHAIVEASHQKAEYYLPLIERISKELSEISQSNIQKA